jgi:hypothetical protein
MFSLLFRLHTTKLFGFQNMSNNELDKMSEFMDITHISIPLYLSEFEPNYVRSRIVDESTDLWKTYMISS